MTTPVKIISRLRGLGIKLMADGDRLRFEGPKGALTPELLATLRERKPELLEFLKRVAGPKNRKIARRENANEPPPLSYAQQRLWFLHQMNPHTDAYNVLSAIRLQGKIQIPAVVFALNEIVKRHETLRTTFKVPENVPVQWIAPRERVSVTVPLLDLSGLTRDRCESLVLDLTNRIGAQAFDLEQGPLFRPTLIRASPETHILAINIHHIVTDGWSRGILVREFFTLYAARSRGLAPPLRELPIQYADFSVWQRKWLTGEVVEHQCAFWKRQLEGAPGFIRLPADRRHPPVKTYAGNLAPVRIDHELSNRLEALTQDGETTPFMLLQAVFLVLLHRYSGEDDLVIGSPVANRNRKETEPLIGFFVNTLAFRHNFFGDPGFTDFLKRVRQNVIEAYSHQDIPFEQVVEMVKPERNTGVPPLFQVLFTMQSHLHGSRGDRVANKRARLAEISISMLPTERITAKFDLTLSLVKTRRGFQGGIEYNSDIFEADTIQRMIGHLRTLMESIVERPDLPVSRLQYLTESERSGMVSEWTDKPSPAFPFPGLVPPWLARTATGPDAIAVTWEDRNLTFARLHGRAGEIAAIIETRAPGMGAVLAVSSPSPTEVLAAWLAVLATGNTILPLHPRLPREQLLAQLEDSRAQFVLVGPEMRARLDWYSGTMVPLREPGSAAAESRIRDPRPLKRETPVFVFYPKSLGGRTRVNWTAGQVSDLCQWFGGLASMEAGTVLLDTWPVSSAQSVKTAFSALWHGARRVSRDDPQEETRSLERLIEQRQPQLLCGKPVRLLPLVALAASREYRAFHGLRAAFLSGGRVPLAPVSRWLRAQPGVRVFNLYGNTACGDAVACCEFALDRDYPGAQLPIGRPIGGNRALVVDRGFLPVPVGIAGELAVALPGPDAHTQESRQFQSRLVADPFESGGRLYRTGDLVKRLSDGSLVYLGALRDRALFNRGIDIGEIEGVLAEHESTGLALVLREPEGADRGIVAYVLPVETEDSHPKPNPERWFRYLKERFPEAWLPRTTVVLDKLPLTVFGELEAGALPRPGLVPPLGEHAMPGTPIEKALAGIWSEVLRRDIPGVHRHFFELGGTSLLATQVVSRIRERLRIDVSLVDLFRSPTVAGLAEVVKNSNRFMAAPNPPKPVSRERPPDLSFAQQRLWFLDQLEGNSPVFNIFTGLRLRGQVGLSALERAFLQIAHRHESLRTTFFTLEEEARPVQIVHSVPEFCTNAVDLCRLDGASQRRVAESIASEEANRPFDLFRGPLLRVCVLRLSSKDHVLLTVMHHIISDGWSMGIMIGEWVRFYLGLMENRPVRLPPLPIQYADYAVWQRQWLRGENLEKQLAFWKDRVADAPSLLRLATDYPRPGRPSHRGGTCPIRLEQPTSAAFRDLTKAAGASLFMGLHTVFSILLARYSGQQDVCIGTPIAGRNHRETENLIGFFVNTLVLRTVLKGNPSFFALLEEVRQTALLSFAHQDIPFERIVEACQPERNLTHSPLFQVMFVFQNTPPIEEKLPGLRIAPLSISARATVEYDLILTLAERGGAITGMLQFALDLFQPATVQRMSGHFENLIRSIVREPQKRVFDFGMMDVAERKRLLIDWNRNPRAAEIPKPLSLAIEERALQKPDAAALSLGRGTLLRGKLNTASEILARRLKATGTEPGVVVALHARRSMDTVIAILAILRAGGVYLPLDPSLPPERTRTFLTDANARILVGDRDPPSGFGGAFIRPDPGWAETCAGGERSPAERFHPWESMERHLAYIIYTSGSSGNPKGVCIDRAAIEAHCHETSAYYGLAERDTVLQFTSFNFDTSLEQLLCPLTAGSRLLVRGNRIRSLEETARLLRDLPITVADFPTSFGLQLVQVWASSDYRPNRALRLFILGGEALPENVARTWHKLEWPDVTLLNAYGPTETTITATVRSLGKDEPVTIGRPLAGRSVYVLDPFFQPVPIGVTGELYIGGASLARGYLNRPDFTAERFLPNPFFADRGGGGWGETRLYRTGDLVRYHGNGTLGFLGRADHQVKIRGFRIELGEIEAVLARHPRVVSALVMVREDRPGQRELTAYIQEKREGAETPGETSGYRSFLRTVLPDYMVPRSVVVMDRFPLTPGGSPDRTAFPAPVREVSRDFTPPRNPIEEMLCGIWVELLQLERVGVHANFFELGGHSLLATRVLSRCREAFELELSLQAFFESPTIAGFGRHIEAMRRSGSDSRAPEIVPVPRMPGMVLSIQQERTWYSMAHIEGQYGAYNMPIALRMRGPLDFRALERSLTRIVARHEMLRTVFPMVEGTPVQVIGTPFPMIPPMIDLESLAPEQVRTTVRRLFVRESGRCFKPMAGPLFAVHLIRLSPTETLFLVNMNHIISDGWSTEVLVRELSAFYQGFIERPGSGEAGSSLPPLAIQYADYAHWQRNTAADRFETAHQFWVKRLADAPRRLTIHGKSPKPGKTSLRGANEGFWIDAGQTRALHRLSRTSGATLFMTLQTGFAILLSHYSGQNDILIGTPVAHRKHRELEPLIGLFFNLLPLRITLPEKKETLSLRELLRRVRHDTLVAFDHPDFVFERLLEELQIERAAASYPLFQATFAMQNTPRGDFSLPGLALERVNIPTNWAKYDLTLFVTETGDRLMTSFRYRSQIFERDTIRNMIRDFQAILAVMARDPEPSLGDIFEALRASPPSSPVPNPEKTTAIP